MNYEEDRIQKEYEERLRQERMEDVLSRALLKPPTDGPEEP